ncbi:NAC domain-containing protein 87-like [Carya illinoinensis]|uniref:NAC domain-containing protein n=1 Tax=Carya illinoinensis TaxID=32201 RepID=A0A8T1PAV7_CARIL|nr:NAC domain-containing protein 87-like [Carya illinoinensis]KAG6637920.1 hypothetical protein CIPAW_10G000200 [Carya illinoinensis]KAG6690154.1 hypothetical protein I3842_10G000200 [Carya illinoinensis]
MEEAIVVNKGEDLIGLPPGFRFHPTEEEVITYYLTEKVVNSNFSASAIGEADLNKCEPWDLPNKAKMGEKEWYFFCLRDRKYPTGMRTNRATESGYWKATGKDKEIYKGKGCLVGMKKTLVFYKGRAPKGEKTNWVMHEYRLEGKFAYCNLPKSAKDEWVVCRVFHKSSGIKKASAPDALLRMDSFGDDLSSFLPPLVDPSFSNNKRAGCGENNFEVIPSSYLSMRENNQQQLKQQVQKNIVQLPFNNSIPITTYQASLMSNSTANPFLNPGSNPPFSFHANPNLDYLHQGRASSIQSVTDIYDHGITERAVLRAPEANNNGKSGLERQCKVEQFSSNQSMASLSQDTGFGTDMNTEISSVVSKQYEGSNRTYDSLVGPIADLECLWDY